MAFRSKEFSGFELRPAIDPAVAKMAQALKEALATYAHAPLEEKKRMLPIMLADPETANLSIRELMINMATLVTAETLEVLVMQNPLAVEFCARLEIAAGRALSAGVLVENPDGSATVKSGMVDGGILFAMDADGIVLGFAYKSAKDGYAPKKELIHYAVEKSLETIILQEVFGAKRLLADNTYGGGVWDDENIVRNIRFLESIDPALKRDVNLFIGGQNPLLLPEVILRPHDYNPDSRIDRVVYIGAGCAHFTDDEYVDSKVGTPGAHKSNNNKLAGEAERFIGKVTILELARIKTYPLDQISAGVRGYVAESDILRKLPLGPNATEEERELTSLLD